MLAVGRRRGFETTCAPAAAGLATAGRLPTVNSVSLGQYDADWQTRRASPGVVASYGFDSASEIAAGYTAGANGTRCFLDTSVKVLSGGSMRFDLRAGEGSANISGGWSPGASGWGQTFGQNSTFYVQARCRISQSMFDNVNNHWRRSGGGEPDFKVWILHEAGGSTCANLEITIIGPGDQAENIYTHCGNHSARTETTTPRQRDATPYAWQQGWDLSSGPSWTNEANAYPQREYPSTPDQFPADEWFTIYEKINIGTWGSTNSSVEMWFQRQGQSIWRKKVSVNQYALNHNGNPSSGFGNILLTPYMTQLQTTAPTAAYIWFSELIISTQPIPMPLAYTP